MEGGVLTQQTSHVHACMPAGASALCVHSTELAVLYPVMHAINGRRRAGSEYDSILVHVFVQRKWNIESPLDRWSEEIRKSLCAATWMTTGPAYNIPDNKE